MLDSGVYSTNRIKTASDYGECLVDDIGDFKSMIYLFIIQLKTLNSSLKKYFKYKQVQFNFKPISCYFKTLTYCF